MFKNSKLTMFSHVHGGQLRVAVYHGSARHSLASKFDDLDIVLTTYQTLRADFDAEGPLYHCDWHRLVLDEGLKARQIPVRVFTDEIVSTSHSQ
jgi:SNF2 family DNA or RNA helicase